MLKDIHIHNKTPCTQGNLPRPSEGSPLLSSVTPLWSSDPVGEGGRRAGSNTNLPKRPEFGRVLSSNTTLKKPPRQNIEIPKKAAAEGMLL